MRYFLFLALASLVLSCNSDDAPGSGLPAAPRLEVRLTDAPGDYDKVIVEVVDVEFRFAEGETFVADEAYAGSYDLLELTNGLDTVIATAEMPVGELKEVRLILGDENYVHVDGDSMRLSTPSAQQSGLKVKLDGADLQAGRAYVLLLDFDAGRSVVEAGNSGKYNLKPVIRASFREIDDPRDARITGVLAPADRHPGIGRREFKAARVADQDDLVFAGQLFFQFVGLRYSANTATHYHDSCHVPYSCVKQPARLFYSFPLN